MKKFFAFLVLPILALCMVSCDDNDDDGVTLSNKSEKNQAIDADATSAKVTFNAQEDWTATINDKATRSTGSGTEYTGSGSSNSSWIFLDKYEGTAGTVTLNITMDINYTGKERKATITIVSGGSKVTVTITQSAIDAEGEIPTDPDPGVVEPDERIYVKRITEYSYSEDGDVQVDFDYDSRGRVVRVVTTDLNTKEELLTLILNHNQSDITYTYQMPYTLETETEGKPRQKGTRASESETYMFYGEGALRPGDGGITRGREAGALEEASPYRESHDIEWSVTYNNEYLKTLSYTGNIELYNREPDFRKWSYNFGWSNGNLMTCKYDYDGYNETSIARYGSDANRKDVNLDLMWLVSSEALLIENHGMTNIFGLLGYFGKRTDRMPVEVTDEKGEYSDRITYKYNNDGLIEEIELASIDYKIEYIGTR